jgi:hypothetical protein
MLVANFGHSTPKTSSLQIKIPRNGTETILIYFGSCQIEHREVKNISTEETASYSWLNPCRQTSRHHSVYFLTGCLEKRPGINCPDCHTNPDFQVFHTKHTYMYCKVPDNVKALGSRPKDEMIDHSWSSHPDCQVFFKFYCLILRTMRTEASPRPDDQSLRQDAHQGMKWSPIHCTCVSMYFPIG